MKQPGLLAAFPQFRREGAWRASPSSPSLSTPAESDQNGTMASTTAAAPPAPSDGAAPQLQYASATEALSNQQRSKKAKIGRKVFKPAWLQRFPWLRTFPEDLTVGQVPDYIYCLWCACCPGTCSDRDRLATKKLTPDSFRPDTLREHDLTDKHKACQVQYNPANATLDSMMTGDTSPVAKLLRSVITAAFCQTGLASTVKLLVGLQNANGFPVPTNTSNTADNGGIHTLLDAAAKYLVRVQNRWLLSAGVHSMMGDGSTNVAMRELEATAVRAPYSLHSATGDIDWTQGLKGVRVRNQYFGIHPVDVTQSRDGKSFDSAALLHCYNSTMVNRGLSRWVPRVQLLGSEPEPQQEIDCKAFYPAMLISTSFDGASVNMGHKAGLGKLMKDQCQHLVVVHAVAHVLELGVKDASEGIPEIDDVIATNQMACVEYNGSAKKLLSIEAIVSKVSEERESGHAAKFKKLVSKHGIRWQESVHRGVKNVIASWNFICMDLYERACAAAGLQLTLMSSPELFIEMRFKVEFETDGSKKKYTGRVSNFKGKDANGDSIFDVYFRHDDSEIVMRQSEMVSVINSERDLQSSSQGVLYGKMTQYMYLKLNYLLADVTCTLKLISKIFQSDTLTPRRVQTSLATLLEQLDDLKTEGGDYLTAFDSDYDSETTVINRIELQNPETEPRFVEIRGMLCNALSKAMHARFDPILDDPVLAAARAFDHMLWPRDSAALKDHGNVQIEFLLGHFKTVLSTLGVNVANTRKDWIRMKREVSKEPTLMSLPYHDLYDRLFDAESDRRDPISYFNVLVLVLLINVIAMDTSICERIFSRLNSLQSKVRNRMGIKLLQNLMTITMLGAAWKADLSSIPCKEIIEIWREGMKTRRYENKFLWSNAALEAYAAVVDGDVMDFVAAGIPVAHVESDGVT